MGEESGPAAGAKSFRPCGVVAQPEQIRVIRCDGHEVVFLGGDARLLREMRVRADPAVEFRVAVGKRDGSAASVIICRNLHHRVVDHGDAEKAVVHAVIAFVHENKRVGRGNFHEVGGLSQKLIFRVKRAVRVTHPAVHGHRARQRIKIVALPDQDAAGRTVINRGGFRILSQRRPLRIQEKVGVRVVRVVGQGRVFPARRPV